MAVLMVTHDLFLAQQCGTRVGIMQRGKLVMTLDTASTDHLSLDRPLSLGFAKLVAGTTSATLPLDINASAAPPGIRVLLIARKEWLDIRRDSR